MSNIRKDEDLEREVEKVTREDQEADSINTSIAREARSDNDEDPTLEDVPADNNFHGPVSSEVLEEEENGITLEEEVLTTDSVGRRDEILRSTEESNDMAHFLFNVVPDQFTPSNYEGTAMEFEGRAGYLKVADHGDSIFVGYEVDPAIQVPETDPQLTVSGMEIDLADIPQYQDGKVYLVGEVDGRGSWKEVYEGRPMTEVLENAADLDDEIYETVGEVSAEELY